jgi:hypothetical protein
MMKTWTRLLLLLATLAMLHSGPLNAQTVWRCGPDGRTYSDQPCGGGSTLPGTDKRSDAEVRAAREVVARDQALARELHRQNREAERDALSHGSGLAGIAAPPPPVKSTTPKPPKTTPKPKKQPPAGTEIWKAVARVTR